MNNKIKAIIVVIGVLLVAVLAFFAKGKENYNVITSKDFTKLVDKGGYLYYGSTIDEDAIKYLNEKLNDTINVLDSSKDTVKELKEGTLYKFENGKEVFSYTGNISSYELIEKLAEANIIAKTYQQINFSQYKDIIKSDGYNFMFIGSETCGWCTKFKETINEVLKDYNFNVYYIDLSSLTNDEYTALVATDSYMSENEWGTPLNILYKDGKRINVINGYVEPSALINFLKENKVI